MSANIAIVPPELIEKISQGKCVAYIGAGLSMGAGLPDWIRLIQEMIDWSVTRLIPLPERNELDSLIGAGDLLGIAEIVKSRMGTARFREFMNSVFHKYELKPTSTHKLLPDVPFISILTSNYDKLVENAYLMARNGVSIPTFTHLDTEELAGALQSTDFHIVKTHGDIDRINSIILTLKEYRNLIHANEAYKLYLQNVFTTKTVFFLGFSLTDPDLLTILDALQIHLRGVTPQHFALMDANKVSALKAEQFRQNYNINIIRYNPSSESHPEVAEFLKEIISRTPRKLLRQLTELKQDLENIDPHYRVVASSDGKLEVFEKYPGASEEKPLNFSFKVEFDVETEEGKNAKEAYQKHLDTGEPITLSSQFIKDVTIPELFTKLLNINTDETIIEIGPAYGGEIIKTRMILRPQDGDDVTIENIELKKVSGGKKQSIISNVHQNHIFTIKIIFDHTFNERPDTYKAVFSVNINPAGINIKDQLIVDRFYIAAEKGARLFLENPETALPIIPPTYIKFDHLPKSDPKWLPILQALLLIQTTVGETFEVPKSVSVEEINNIFNAAHLIKTGKGKGTINFTMDLDVEVIEKLMADNSFVDFSTYTEEILLIQNKKVSLGSVWITYSAPLSEEEKIRLRQEIAIKPEHNRHLVYFSSAEENPALTYCLNFLPPDEFEELHENQKYRQHSLGQFLTTLFEAAKLDKEEVDINSLLLFFTEAAKQVNDYGKPFNMLRRCEVNELKTALEPHLKMLKNLEEKLLLNKLIELSVIKETDLTKFDQQ
jgi:hypothetical protein